MSPITLLEHPMKYFNLIGLVESLLKKWINRYCPPGEVHQYQFYRCLSCRSLVTHRHIKSGGCACGGGKISPASLSWNEKVKALVVPWTI